MQSGAARKLNYGDDVVRDNVAYDLSRFDKRKRVREALERESAAVPAIKPRGSTKAAAMARAQAKAKSAVSVSPFAVLSYVAVFALMLLVVTSYVHLNELAIQSSSMTSEIAALKSDESKLKVEYERKMNIADIEARAGELGLSTPASDQIVYVDISQSDRAVIIKGETSKTGFVDGLKTIVMSVLDYAK